jgi:hypothetical protein
MVNNQKYFGTLPADNYERHAARTAEQSAPIACPCGIDSDSILCLGLESRLYGS